MENGKWFEVAVDGPLISNLKDFGVQAAVDGVGIAFASQQLIAPHILQGNLVPLLEAWPGAERMPASPLTCQISYTLKAWPYCLKMGRGDAAV